MRHALLLALSLCLASCAATGGGNKTGGSRESAPAELRQWVDARAGTGEPVHWVSEGGVYEYPSGKKLFGMIGFDSSRVFWPENPGDDIVHLTRKTFVYTDPETGEVLTEYNGQPVVPIAYPYQMITYRMVDGIIYGDVEQGVGERIQKIKSENGMRVGMMGDDTMTVTASVFLDFPLPGGRQYEAWENYDFFIHLGDNVDEPHQMSWQRYGGLPPFTGSDSRAIYHLLSWRVESQSEFPPKLLAWAKSAKPQWLNPPGTSRKFGPCSRARPGKAGRSNRVGGTPMVAWLSVFHCAVLGYWLGAELVINSSFRLVSYADSMAFGERARLLDHVMDVDQHVRYALVLQTSLGAMLAAAYGFIPGRSNLIIAIAVLGVLWLVFVEAAHRLRNGKLGARIARVDRASRIVLVAVLLLMAGRVIGGDWPMPVWLRWKLAAFAGVVGCGIGIRYALKGYFEVWALMSDGNLSQANHEAIRRAYRRATGILVLLWAFIAAIVYLSVSKPA